ncbi:MAG: DUF5060 domain-containing protein, partial [Verrucomicrobiota bacterium]
MNRFQFFPVSPLLVPLSLVAFSLWLSIVGLKGFPSNPLLVQRWETLTLSFEGPGTSETANENPFTDYRLLVTFSKGSTKKIIRGFYAADGKAADSGAESGNVWQVRFTPDELGDWRFDAELRRGALVAIREEAAAGEVVPLKPGAGTFTVVESQVVGKAFRAQGRVAVDKGYYRIGGNGK